MKQAVDDVLFSEMDYGKIIQGTGALYELFSEHTQVKAGDLTYSDYIEAETGLAVSIDHAAHCLRDIMRTTYFLRGVYQAINDQMDQTKPVRVLYAGCGPYATLFTPMCTQFAPDQVQCTLMDINPAAIESTQLLYKKLKLEGYVAEYLVADATSALSFDAPYDIIISETMAQALEIESQVPLTRQMVKYLKPGGTFIPQKITVDAYLCGEASLENPSEDPKTLMGNIYTLDFKDIPPKGYQCDLIVPNSPYRNFALYTSIQVYQSEIIKPYESGLTSPITIKRFDKLPERIRFEYVEDQRCRYEITYDPQD